MLASRRRCACTGILLSLSWLLGSADVAVAQNAKGASGQNCGSKTNKGLVPSGTMPNQRLMAVNQPASMPGTLVPMATQPNYQQQTGLFPGQSTPWLMPNQTVVYPNQPLAGQVMPGWGQPGFVMQQPNQPGVGQFQPAVDPNQPGMIGGPAYVPPQPNQPGQFPFQPLVNPNLPGNGRMIPVMVMQPGYLVPVQYSTSNGLYLPPQASTPWLMQPGMVGNQTSQMPCPPNQAHHRTSTTSASHAQHTAQCKKK